MFKLYEIIIYYEKENENRDSSSFAYMDVLNSEDDLKKILFDRHISEHIVTDIEYKEVIFEGYQIVINKTDK